LGRAPGTSVARVQYCRQSPADQRRLHAAGLRRCPAERSPRHAVVADTRGTRCQPPPLLAARRFETIRTFDLPGVNVLSPLNPSQSSRPVELSSALRACRGAFVGIGLLSAVLNVLYLTGSFFMLAVYDRVLPSRSLPTLVALALLAF